MPKSSVQNLYSFWARRYDRIKHFWDTCIAFRAEIDFLKLLQKNIKPESTVLELGCGTGQTLEKLAANKITFSKYLGVDFTPQMLELARQKFPNSADITFQHQDVTNLVGIHEKFDVILFPWVIHYLKSPVPAVNNAQNLLKPNGKMLLIFVSRPKWYVYPLFYPFIKYLRGRLVTPEDIKKFQNVTRQKSFMFNGITNIEISNSQAKTNPQD